ncbi:unnamed protein product, partial [Meganyctiphanes norvegica]
GDSSRVWLGAKGDGSKYVWQQGGLTLRNDSPVWAEDQPGSSVSADYCLYLVVTKSHNSSHPETPYYTSKCSNPSYTTYALCEDGTYDWSAQFKIYKDQKRTWAEAKEKCEQEGYILAQPSDSIAVHLRRYLLENYGDQSRVWLGAKGDGSKYVWQKGGLTLRNDSPVWANGQPGSYVSADYCLYLVVTMGHNSNHPENPYYTSKCSNPSFTTYALCEVNYHV